MFGYTKWASFINPLVQLHVNIYVGLISFGDIHKIPQKAKHRAENDKIQAGPALNIPVIPHTLAALLLPPIHAY